jgi:transcriptional regulator with XRE-family HTH domain
MFGAHVRAARTTAGLTQRQVAERAGLTPNYVTGVELGKRNVTLRTTLSLADAVGCPAWALLVDIGGTMSGIVPPPQGALAIELPPGDAFVVARAGAGVLRRPIDLIDPITRRVEQSVSPADDPRPPGSPRRPAAE